MAQESTKRVQFIFTGNITTTEDTPQNRKILFICDGFFNRPNVFSASEVKTVIRSVSNEPFGDAELSNKDARNILKNYVKQEMLVLPLQVGIEVEVTKLAEWATVTHADETFISSPKVFRVTKGDSSPVLIAEV